ncbi:MAG: 3-isopropylmalate dehydratase small subunit [Spirochaetales bacterium]|nr:3-isopropylmalate dehydratase small subunit [Spirochaetales bacterium]
MKNILSGRVWLLGDNIDTDIIIPTQFMTLPTIEAMSVHAFSPLRPELAGMMKPGDILVAGSNFGCGSSREQAPEVIKALGVCTVIARSFARIFFRNAINNGLPVIENSWIQEYLKEGHTITIDTVSGEIILPDGTSVRFPPLPGMLIDMIDAGGLVPFYRKKNKGGVL